MLFNLIFNNNVKVHIKKTYFRSVWFNSNFQNHQQCLDLYFYFGRHLRDKFMDREGLCHGVMHTFKAFGAYQQALTSA